MGRQFKELAGATITSTTNVDFDVPGFARSATFYLDVTTASGTLPTLNGKLQYTDPTGTDEFVDVSGGAFNQLTASDTQATLSVGPGLASDAVGADRHANAPLGSRMRFVATVGGTDPSFAYTLSADFEGN